MALIYSISCPVSLDGDVTKRRLNIEVNDKEIVNQEFHYNLSNFGEYSFEEGDEVLISLVNIDNAGNVSEPSITTFIAKDTIPPEAPAGIGVSLLREENDPPAKVTTPEPEVKITTPEPEPEVSPSGYYSRW